MVINEFQTILIGAGASVVAVVWIYNLVQERKHRKAAEAIFQGTQRPAPSEPSTGSDGVFANPAGPGSEPVPIEPPLGDDFEEGIVRRIEPVLFQWEAEAPAEPRAFQNAGTISGSAGASPSQTGPLLDLKRP